MTESLIQSTFRYSFTLQEFVMSNSFTILFGLLPLLRPQVYQSHFQVYYEMVYLSFERLNLHPKNSIIFLIFLLSTPLMPYFLMQ